MIEKAILSIRPGSRFSLTNNDFDTLVWFDDATSPPSFDEVTTEVARLQAEHERTEYQRKRAAEYPPMADYLDAVVKGDQAQIDAYIAACQAVKAKYPKPA
jgi:hypothetical protein